MHNNLNHFHPNLYQSSKTRIRQKIQQLSFHFREKMVARWIPDWPCLHDFGWENFVADGIQKTVASETQRKYKSAFSRLFDFLVMFALPFNLESLIRFLHACRQQGARGTTLEGYRSAVLWVQRVSALETFAADDRLVRAVDGYRHFDKCNGTPRGAITFAMLQQLLGAFPMFQDTFLVIFLCVLRVTQLVRMRVGDAVMTPDGAVVLTVRAEKRNRCGTAYTSVSRKEIVHPLAKELLGRLQQGRVHGEPMFPSFSAAAANETIQRAAAMFRWPAGLQFDGVHCLRHGGCQFVKNFVAALLASMGGPCAMSAGTIAGVYGRMNEVKARLDNSDSDEEA